MFYQIFLSLQVKRWAIITYKHGIYELPHESPNDLRFRILENTPSFLRATFFTQQAKKISEFTRGCDPDPRHGPNQSERPR